MYANFIIVTFSAMILISCNYTKNHNAVKEFVPGIYAAAWAMEMTQTVDTILLEPLTVNGSETFRITRKSRVTYVNTAKNRPPEYRIVRWTGIFDEKSKTIFINNNGRALSFDPKNRNMWIGTIKYRKL